MQLAPQADTTLLLAWLPHPGAWPGVAARLRQLGRTAARMDGRVRVAAVTGAGGDLGPDVSTVHIGGSPAASIRRYRLLSEALSPATGRVVLRCAGTADPSLPWWLQRWGRRTISEHHGDTVVERRTSGGIGRAMVESLGLRALLRGVAGHIGVTPEIVALHARLAPPSLPSAWVGNGVDVASMPPTGCRRYDGGPLDIAAVLGNAAPWHGIDRLLAGLAGHRGHRVVLHLIGDATEPGRRSIGPAADLVTHGRLAGTTLDAVLAGMHLGVASLALHRAGLTQACPLKSREYAARGLPYIAAYDDPDVPEGTPGVLHLPAGDAPLPIGPLFEFASGLPTATAEQLRRYALERLDWSAILARIDRFARETCP